MRRLKYDLERKSLETIYKSFIRPLLEYADVICTQQNKNELHDFNFEIVNFPFLDGDFPRSPSNGVYISQLVRFASVCSNVDDFNNKNLF